MLNSPTKLSINLSNEQKEQHGPTSLQQYDSFIGKDPGKKQLIEHN